MSSATLTPIVARERGSTFARSGSVNRSDHPLTTNGRSVMLEFRIAIRRFGGRLNYAFPS
jgi:hypothetical protein